MGWLAWFGVALMTCAMVVFVWRRSYNRRARKAERAARPGALASAELHYMERLFRIRLPIPLTARLDRGYLDADGSVVLVELKTRSRDRVYLTDVIQLSAQRMAVEGQTGQHVAPHAFVTIRKPVMSATPLSRKVELMPAADIVVLYRLRQDVLAGRVAPRYAWSSKACRGCAYRPQCDRPA